VSSLKQVFGNLVMMVKPIVLFLLMIGVVVTGSGKSSCVSNRNWTTADCWGLSESQCNRFYSLCSWSVSCAFAQPLPEDGHYCHHYCGDCFYCGLLSDGSWRGWRSCSDLGFKDHCEHYYDCVWKEGDRDSGTSMTEGTFVQQSDTGVKRVLIVVSLISFFLFIGALFGRIRHYWQMHRAEYQQLP